MTAQERELEILEALDKGELTKQEADDLMGRVKSQAEPIKQEIHPAFELGLNNMKGMGTRFKYKNFATNPEQGMAFIQERHPDLQFKTDDRGNVLAKKPDEQEWRYMDVPGSFDTQDISDVLYDVPAGLVEGGASALGGVAGGFAGLFGGPAAPVTVPLGALGGASAAGAGTANVLERGRQGLGKYFGVGTQNQDQIDNATLFGAASPLFFGTGAGVKQVAKGLGKTALKGYSKPVQDAVIEQVARGQSGVVGRGFGAVKGQVLPRIAQTGTNIDKGTYQWAADNLDKIQNAEDMYGSVGIYEDLSTKLLDSHQAVKSKHGEQIGQALENANFRVDAAEIEAPLQDLLKKYQDRAAKQIEKHGEAALNKVDVQNAEYLEKVIGEYTQGGGVLKGAEAQHFLDTLNDLTGVRKSTVPGKLEKVDRELQNAAKQAARKLDDTMSLSDPNFKEAKTLYKRDLEREKTLKQYFENPEKTESTLNNLLSPKKNAKRKKVMQIAEEVGVPIDEAARESIATSIFSNPSREVLSIGGRTSTGVKIPAEIVGGAAGYYAGSQLGDGHGSGVAGLLAGKYLGGRMFAPSTIRSMMEMNARGKAFNQGIQNFTPASGPNLYQAVPQVWQNLEDNRR